jgi:cytochrome P450
LRLEAPANTTPRTVLKDVEIAGVSIPRGACLFMMWGSGSRDEAVFANAEEFNLDRKNKRQHTTFGIGIHFCAGLHLARAELVMSVTRWLKEFDQVAFAIPKEEVHYDPIFAFRALSHLPLRFTRAAAPDTPTGE